MEQCAKHLLKYLGKIWCGFFLIMLVLPIPRILGRKVKKLMY